MSADRTRRHRDPERKQRILSAAAALGARRGFHAISMADIGAAAGIVGSGVYRHFASKTAILVAMLDQVMDRLADQAAQVVASAGAGGDADGEGTLADGREALAALVRGQIEVAIADRDVLAVYHREAHTLPDEDWLRLRRRQRLYIEEWVHLLAPLRPDLADAELRLTVHAAIGAIQSTLFFRSGLPDARQADLLEGIAHACLGTAGALTSVI